MTNLLKAMLYVDQVSEGLNDIKNNVKEAIDLFELTPNEQIILNQYGSELEADILETISLEG